MRTSTLSAFPVYPANSRPRHDRSAAVCIWSVMNMVTIKSKRIQHASKHGLCEPLGTRVVWNFNFSEPTNPGIKKNSISGFRYISGYLPKKVENYPKKHVSLWAILLCSWQCTVFAIISQQLLHFLNIFLSCKNLFLYKKRKKGL